MKLHVCEENPCPEEDAEYARIIENGFNMSPALRKAIVEDEAFKQRILEILPEEMSLNSRNGDYPEGWNACLAEICKRAGIAQS